MNTAGSTLRVSAGAKNDRVTHAAQASGSSLSDGDGSLQGTTDAQHLHNTKIAGFVGFVGFVG